MNLFLLGAHVRASTMWIDSVQVYETRTAIPRLLGGVSRRVAGIVVASGGHREISQQ
jgi:hypothetical protein